jgi:hypothetical protein
MQSVAMAHQCWRSQSKLMRKHAWKSTYPLTFLSDYGNIPSFSTNSCIFCRTYTNMNFPQEELQTCEQSLHFERDGQVGPVYSILWIMKGRVTFCVTAQLNSDLCLICRKNEIINPKPNATLELKLTMSINTESWFKTNENVGPYYTSSSVQTGSNGVYSLTARNLITINEWQ